MVPWTEIFNCKLEAPYVPVVKYFNFPFVLNFYRSVGDTSNFADYPDSGSQGEAVPTEKDPFLTW